MNIKQRIKELISIQLAKNPGRMVLLAILLFNLVFIVISAVVISKLALSGTEKMGFLEAAFYTITMILDAGCVQFVISDIGQSGIIIAIICLLIIIIGMVLFTGSVIGYVTNYISSFIQDANAGQRKLHISNHLVILNWNTRASEIVNDLLFCRGVQRVVVMSDKKQDDIYREVNERIADTIQWENRKLRDLCRTLPFPKSVIRYFKEHMYNNVVLIVREGDVFSAKQLADITLDQARSVVILGNDVSDTVCKYNMTEMLKDAEKGNALTVKTLMQVSDITSAAYSADKQKIIVEVTDDWTLKLVERIIQYKQVSSKCNIVPVRVNQILGQILAQFSIMPELNLAYQELFSNKGATFYVEEQAIPDEETYIGEYIRCHDCALPLTAMQTDSHDFFYYVAESEKSIRKQKEPTDCDFNVKLNYDYWMEQKDIIILGHNSKSRDIMEGFKAFGKEWNPENEAGVRSEILRIIVIDDLKSLERMNYYREYPFVIDTVAATIFDQELICSTVEEFVDSSIEDTSVLILSDDSVPSDQLDANALANLVYIQDIISARKKQDPDFDPESIDVIVEIINPKHHDIVSSYSVDNVVISNRYISKMITQIGEKEAIFTFYSDILTYDEDDTEADKAAAEETEGAAAKEAGEAVGEKADENIYKSKEVYTKLVSAYFREIPGECTQEQLVRAVWEASTDRSVPPKKRNPAIVLGYVKPGGRVTLFGEDQAQRKVKLEPKDKIIIFTNH